MLCIKYIEVVNLYIVMSPNIDIIIQEHPFNLNNCLFKSTQVDTCHKYINSCFIFIILANVETAF